MVRPEVDEDMADAVLPERLEESERCCVAADSQYQVSLYMRTHAVLTPWCLQDLCWHVLDVRLEAAFRAHVWASPMTACVGVLYTPWLLSWNRAPNGQRPH